MVVESLYAGIRSLNLSLDELAAITGALAIVHLAANPLAHLVERLDPSFDLPRRTLFARPIIPLDPAMVEKIIVVRRSFS